MRRRAFEKLVEGALEALPEEFRRVLDNLAVVVEDWPDPALAEEVTGAAGETLYGLFAGTPLAEQHLEDSGELPPVIFVYQGPLEKDFPGRRELERETKITLVHEIAHFMGLDEEAIRAYGYE